MQPLSRYYSYLHTAANMLDRYDGAEPFPSYSKKYFAANKKIGSRDRKLISHLCYCYFRAARAIPGSDIERKITLAHFLCSATPNEMLDVWNPEWNEKAALPLAEKLKIAGIQTPAAFFPWQEELGGDIDKLKFSASVLVQPPVYVRVRPGKMDHVVQQLTAAGIEFRTISKDCLSAAPAAKLDTALALNRDAVIQDYSSQRVAELLHLVPSSTDILKVWDCCAASGGKSMLAHDTLQNVQLTVSDIRESVLANLRRRFSEAGIKEYDAFVTDLSAPKPIIPSRIKWEHFDLVIADVPCTGSGTWGRSPEQLYFFDPSSIEKYAAVQKQICKAVIDFMKPGGYLLYCTCSVFRAENEASIEWLQKKFHLQLLKMESLTGYEMAADNLFAALLQKN